MDSVIILRTGQLGDTIVALPALAAARKIFEKHRVIAVIDKHPGRQYVSAKGILMLSGYVDEVAEYSADNSGGGIKTALSIGMIVRRLGAKTGVYLMHSTRRESIVRRDCLFLRAFGVRRIYGNEGPFFGSACEAPSPLAEQRPEYINLLRRLPGGGDLNPQEEVAATVAQWRQVIIPHLETGSWEKLIVASGARRLVAVCTGAKNPSKLWPAPCWQELILRATKELGIFPVFLGGSEDHASASAIIARSGVGLNLAGELSIPQAGALIARCAAYLGHDTGTMHLAASVGTKCVGLFAARDWPQLWAPMGEGHVCLRSVVPCEGCMIDRCPHDNLCLRSISVDDVVRALRRVLPEANTPDGPILN